MPRAQRAPESGAGFGVERVGAKSLRVWLAKARDLGRFKGFSTEW